MKSKLTDVRTLMDDSVFKDEMFTVKHKQQVLNRITKQERKGYWVPRSLSVVFSLILIVSVGYLLSNVLSGMDGAPVQQGNPDGAEQQTPQQEPTESVVPPVSEDPETEETEVAPNEEENETAEDGVFELTPEEMAAYEKFTADFDTAHLKELEPISVAKLYVWAGYNQNYEAEYELLTDREESVMWDKEYHMAIPAEHRGKPEEEIKFFRNIDSGEFRSIEEFRGVIIFRHADGPEGTAGMQMVQNEDGVWQVGFMALQ